MGKLCRLYACVAVRVRIQPSLDVPLRRKAVSVNPHVTLARYLTGKLNHYIILMIP